MNQNEDPSLDDVIRSVHATGEDRFGTEHGEHPKDPKRERQAPENDEEHDDDSDSAPTS